MGNTWEWTETDGRGPPPDEGYAWVFGGSFAHRCVSDEGSIARQAVSEDKEYLYLGFRCAYGGVL